MTHKLVTSVSAENPVLGDLELNEGQFVHIGGDITDVESYKKDVAQRVTTRILFFRGEWYLDQLQGFPWREKVLGKEWVRIGEEGIKKLIRQAIVITPGIASIENLNINIDSNTRLLTITVDMYTDTNTPVTIEDFEVPYLIGTV